MSFSRKGFACAAVLAGLTALTGCPHSSPTARRDQVPTGYQPAPKVNEKLVNCERRGPNEFHITLKSPPTVEEQRNESWCWAASSAAVLDYHKVKLGTALWTQDDVVQTVAPDRMNQTGDENDVITALTPELQVKLKKAEANLAAQQARRANDNGFFAVISVPLPDSGTLVSELAAGNPVVVAEKPTQGDIGHIVVAVGVRCSEAATSDHRCFIWSIDTLDPKDGKPGSIDAFSSTPGDEQNGIDRVAFAISRPAAMTYVAALTKADNSPKWTPNPPPQTNSGGTNTHIHTKIITIH